jgi:glucokinase
VDGALAIGVDLGGTGIRAAVVQVDPFRMMGQTTTLLPTADADRTPEKVVDLVAEQIALLGAPPATPVGIGAAGILSRDGVVANAPQFPNGWRGVRLGEILTARLGHAPALDNDVNAITWGEHRFGVARGFSDVLCVFIGTGVGGGLVTGGRLVRGANGMAGEIGHMQGQPLTPRSLADLLPCACGRRGCLEAYAGGRNLAARSETLRASIETTLGPISQPLHAGHLDQAAAQGCAPARATIVEAAERLADALAIAATLCDPAIIVLGGGVWDGAPSLRETTFAAYAARIAGREYGRPPLHTSELGRHAGAVGAAALAATQPA